MPASRSTELLRSPRRKAYERTRQRKASVLLNSETLRLLPDIIEEIPAEAGIIGYSTATIALNANTSSVKSQAEHVVAVVALDEAQRGERVGPMALHPSRLARYVDQNAATLAGIVEACALPAAQRERV